MTFKLPADLPARLSKAGLKVVEIPGWKGRGRPASTGGFAPVGVLNHHIGSTAGGTGYAAGTLVRGRSDLPGPLCQLSLGRDGTVYLVAAGRANHAGVAKSVGSVAAGDGNSLYVGIEWQLSGVEPISTRMYDAGATLNAVLLQVLGSSERTVHCHYETSVTGKWDIGDPNGIHWNGKRVLDVAKFAARVKTRKAELYPAKPVPVVTPPAVVGTKKAPKRRVAHFDDRIANAGGILGDSLAGTKKADRENYRWIDCDGHLTKDLQWVNAHGAPYNPKWLKTGDKFEHHYWSTLHKKHPKLRSSLLTFIQNAKRGLSTEWEVKDLHPLVGEHVLDQAFKQLAVDAEAAYGPEWRKHVQVKVLTNLGGGLAYAKKICRHAHGAGFKTMVLPRGFTRLKKVNEPYITFNRGGRV